MAQEYQARATIAEQSFQLLADSTYLPSVMLKYQEGGGDALTPEEQFRVTRFYMGLRVRFDNLYYQYQLGFLDEQYYEANVANFLRTVAPVWADLGVTGAIRPAFQEEIERILSEAEAQS